MTRTFYTLIQLLLILCLAVFISACGSGDGGGEEGHGAAWIRIDSPEDGFLTGASTITIKGNAAFYDIGIYPSGTVTWSSAGQSGSTGLRVTCLISCIGYFETTVPLSLGQNTITVTYQDGRDSVTGSRFPLVSVGGRVIRNGSLVGIRDITMTLSGINNRTGQSRDSSIQTSDNGPYLFQYVESGTYTIVPSLPPPQSSTCYSFEPSSRTINVITTDVLDQDFIATEVVPCYSISGRITPSTNPSFGTSNVKVFLADVNGAKQLHYTDANGMYYFYHLAPGAYTVTPEMCSVNVLTGLEECAIFTPASRTVTITTSDRTGQDFVREVP